MSTLLDVVVRDMRAQARDIVSIELAPAAPGTALPGAEAGAHIDLHLPSGLVRQYSLTRPEARPATYTIAVGRDANSRGGSRWIHEQLRVGARLRIGAPRNNFALDPAHRRVLLLAGGIGITPIYAMAQTCDAEARDWQLHACARSAARLPYQEELRALAGDRMTLHFDDAQGRPYDFRALLARQRWDALYACGPAPMLAAVREAAAHWPAEAVRFELFQAPEAPQGTRRAFELVLARSGTTTTVSPGESVLDALERLGVEHPCACREGICGSCEATLLEGQAEHCDLVLSPAERAANRRFMVCVSRCAGDRLVLDL